MNSHDLEQSRDEKREALAALIKAEALCKAYEILLHPPRGDQSIDHLRKICGDDAAIANFIAALVCMAIEEGVMKPMVIREDIEGNRREQIDIQEANLTAPNWGFGWNDENGSCTVVLFGHEE